MTLIAVYNSDGCVGRCDERCYGVHSPECDCVCGGKNHGVGLTKASENTQAQFTEWMERYTADRKEQLSCQVKWQVPGLQMALPVF